MGNARNLIDRIEHKFIRADADTVVVELEDLISENAMVDLCFVAMKQYAVFLTREVITPQTAFLADDEIGVVAMPRPMKWSWSIQLHSFLAKGDLSAFEDDPQN